MSKDNRSARVFTFWCISLPSSTKQQREMTKFYKLIAILRRQYHIVLTASWENIQSMDDFDEANEDEQRQLSYAISGRNNFNPQPTVSREVHGQQEPLASSAQFLQPPRARMPLQPISMPNSSAFRLTSFNPTMMRAQEQNLLKTFNYCQVSFNFKSCKSSRPAIPSVKPIRRCCVHIIESDSDSD